MAASIPDERGGDVESPSRIRVVEIGVVLALERFLRANRKWRLASATCVSALFGIKSLKVLLRGDHDDVSGFPIRGPVRKIFANSESSGLSIFSRDIFFKLISTFR